jgi:hypothetical protein
MSKRQPGITAGQRHAGTGSDSPSPEAVDKRTRNWRGQHCYAYDQADHQAGDAKTEAATIVEVDDLEGQDGAIADVVQEDSEHDEPQLARESIGRRNLSRSSAFPCLEAAPTFSYELCFALPGEHEVDPVHAPTVGSPVTGRSSAVLCSAGQDEPVVWNTGQQTSLTCRV